MTLEDIHQKLSKLAHSGMEDNNYFINPTYEGQRSIKSHLVKKERRRLIKESSVQLSLFD
ncbi:hypothetical protein DHD32_20880 [Arenibacter sp. TNZ]|jgi:hypothetical protein|uniref:hypothetical protein n=1 Tax=Arenibacter TaxID=178469 RepID=UPI000CD3CF03|nr:MULTISPECIES: hypothetical protein [Arenibacter]MCM4173929.1 hypothetical protein [Arenibacter sp. TNZ]